MEDHIWHLKINTNRVKEKLDSITNFEQTYFAVQTRK